MSNLNLGDECLWILSKCLIGGVVFGYFFAMPGLLPEELIRSYSFRGITVEIEHAVIYSPILVIYFDIY